MKKILILLFVLSVHLNGFGQIIIKLIPFVSYDRRTATESVEVKAEARITCDMDKQIFIVEFDDLSYEYKYERIEKANDSILETVYNLYVNNKVLVKIASASVTVIDYYDGNKSYYFGLGNHADDADIIEYDFFLGLIVYDDQVTVMELYDAIEAFYNKQSTGQKLNKNDKTTMKSVYHEPHAVFHGTNTQDRTSWNSEGKKEIPELLFQCNVTVYDIYDDEVQFTLYVDGKTRGKGLYSPEAIHKTSEGNVAIGGSAKGRSDSPNSKWSKFTLALPFYELGLSDGSQTINVRWFASHKGKFIGNSNFQTIHFTKKGDKITSFRVDGGNSTPGFYD